MCNAYRGNTEGPDLENENSLTAVENSINKGFDCEVDLWVSDEKFFGHDKPQFLVEMKFLETT